MIRGAFDGGAAIVGLCAAIAVGVAGCDEAATSRGDDFASTLPEPEDNPCDGLAERIVECADDEGCDLDVLQTEFEACTASGKADGPVDWIKGEVDELKQSLVNRAQACYDDRDADCLWWTYWSLAAGARVLQLPTAANNMFNFLNCGDNPLLLDTDALRADPTVEYTEQAFLDHAWCEGTALASMQPDVTTTVTIPGMVVAAENSDIWYGLGNFTMSGEATVVISGGVVQQVELTTRVYDIYDWHAGLSAQGDSAVVQDFQDEWAAWLVEQGEACEFEMTSEWTETVWEHQPVGCELPDSGEEPRDE
ncbi:MAG: hypothetical protein AAF799_34890 [Myxococcota bacterium]